METATLSGTVLDQSGLVVPGAQVQVTSSDTGIATATETNKAGVYVIPSLKPGRYRILISKEGFKQISVTDVVLNVQDVVSRNFNLQLGATSETISVSASASDVRTSPAVVTVVDERLVRELPLNGRSFQTLFQLTPGVVIASANYNEQGQFNINGQRANANYFMVDGVSANVGQTIGFGPGQSVGGSLPALTQAGGTNGLVSVDALQEFAIQTSGYAAEFGRTPGGQISILTRSGTNTFHGRAFDYLRNDLFDANDWFANRLGLQKAALRQNDFGGVLGGPILKDKTFFFFSYEGLRLRQPTTALSDVPTLAARQAASPTIRPFLDAFPLPTGADEGNGLAPANYAFSNPFTLDAESLRIDHQISGHLTAFARYNRSTSDLVSRGAGFSLATLFHRTSKLQTATAGMTWAVRPTLGNEVRFNWSWSEAAGFDVNDAFKGAVPLSLSSLIPSGQSVADTQFMLSIDSGNASGLIYGPLSKNLQRQLNFIDNIIWETGRHLVKIGVDYRRLTPQINQVSYGQASNFASVDDLLAGNPTDGATVFSEFGPVDLTYANYSLFAQDVWKTTQRLTLTYGLRWDYNPAPSAHGANGLPFLTVVGISNLATLSPAPVGTPLYHATSDNFAPRFGIAYVVRDSKGYEAVVRSGFGVFYDLGSGSTGNISTKFPFTHAHDFNPSEFPLSPTDAAGFTPTLAPPFADMNGYPQTLRLPYTYHWNLSYEQSLGSNQTVTVGYVASAGHSLIRQDLFEGGQLSPNFSSVIYTSNLGFSKYNALQVQARRIQAKGLAVLASYTWAHSLDNSSNDSHIAGPLSTQIDAGLNYGSSDFDIRHTGTFAIDYEPPFLPHSAWARAIVSGWAANTFFIARTAPPVDVNIFRNLGLGFQTYRPDLVPGVSPYISDPMAPGGIRLNSSAFSVPLEPRQGNLGRNALRGFPLFQQDFSIRRGFHIRENLQLQARLEAFNVLNHPNFASQRNLLGFFTRPPFTPLGSFGASQSMFGVGASGGANPAVSSGFNPLYQVGGPRSLQIGLKLAF